MYKIFLILVFLFVNSAYPKENELVKDFDIYEPKQLPEVEFYDYENKKYLLEDFDDNIVILHFWATWCTVCVNELPELDRLKKDFKKNPVKIIAISEDFKACDTVKDFYSNFNIKNLDIYMDKKNKLFNAFNIVGLPTTIFINKKNMEIGRVSGKLDWYNEELRQKILSIN